MRATVYNMIKCREKNLPIVMINDAGMEFSANPDDYFWMGMHEEIPEVELAVKEVKTSYRDPIELLDKQSSM